MVPQKNPILLPTQIPKSTIFGQDPFPVEWENGEHLPLFLMKVYKKKQKGRIWVRGNWTENGLV